MLVFCGPLDVRMRLCSRRRLSEGVGFFRVLASIFSGRHIEASWNQDWFLNSDLARGCAVYRYQMVSR